MSLDASRAYDRLASVYDGLAAVWSGGRIAACHRLVGDRLHRGERALFVGAGGGQDAAAAAARGVRTTLLDVSPAMLSRARRRVRARGGSPETIEADFRTFTVRIPYDAVVASFFLNVFAAQDLAAIVARLRAATRRGGRILIADFAPLAGAALARLLQRAYHDIPMHGFACVAGSARHPIHDLAPALEAEGIEIAARIPARVFGIGPAWLEVIEGRVR